jgi:hypothetical protein
MGHAREEVLHAFLNVVSNEYRSGYSIDSKVCGKSIVADEVLCAQESACKMRRVGSSLWDIYTGIYLEKTLLYDSYTTLLLIVMTTSVTFATFNP